jgi:hypothetical protein
MKMVISGKSVLQWDKGYLAGYALEKCDSTKSKYWQAGWKAGWIDRKRERI